MSASVWVTRPAQSAKELAALFEKQGVACFVEALMQIAPLESVDHIAAYTKAMERFDHVDACIFISANAVEYWLKIATAEQLQAIKTKKIFAVGRATQAALADVDIKSIAPQKASSSEALLALEELQNVDGMRFYIFRGVDGRGYLQQQLNSRGATAEHVEIYLRKAVSKVSEKIQSAMDDGSLKAITVGSVETFDNLLQCLPNLPKTIGLIVPSQRVASRIEEAGDFSVHISPTALNDDMVSTTLNIINAKSTEADVNVSSDKSNDDAKPVNTPKSEGLNSQVKTEETLQKSSNGRFTAVVAVFAFLIALAASAAIAWIWYQQTPLTASIDQQNGQILAYKKELSRLSSAINKTEQALQSAQASRDELSQQAVKLQRDNWQLQQRINELFVTDRSDWQFAEIEYLLRLAHQRVMVGEQVDSALALLKQADEKLNSLDRADLWSVREQIAADINRLQLANELDKNGVYLQLQALLSQTETIQLMKNNVVPEQSKTSIELPQAPENSSWYSPILDAAKSVLSLYNIRKTEQKVQPILSEEQRWLLHQRLTLHLAQAQQAVITSDASMYVISLNNAKNLLQTYAISGGSSQRFIDRIEELLSLDVGQALPDISGSHTVLTEYLKVYRASSSEKGN